MFHIAFLLDLTRPSHTPPKFGAPVGLNAHLVHNLAACSSNWVPFGAATSWRNSRAAPSKVLPKSDNFFWIRSSGHKSMDRIKITLRVQCWHYFQVNCSCPETGEKTSPILHYLLEVLLLKWSEIVHSTIAERINIHWKFAPVSILPTIWTIEPCSMDNLKNY